MERPGWGSLLQKEALPQPPCESPPTQRIHLAECFASLGGRWGVKTAFLLPFLLVMYQGQGGSGAGAGTASHF